MVRLLVTAGLGCVLLASCSVSDIVGTPTVSNSTTAQNPDAVKNPTGAIAFYYGILSLQGNALNSAVRIGGLFGDELRSVENWNILTDARQLEDVQQSSEFVKLQVVRANARQGRGILSTYAPAAPQALIGHLYAIEAMADVQLAELYCSGIPLSTAEYDGTIIMRAGSSTEEVYRVAIALFDSALTLAQDSARILNFARVGKGRALLGLGEFQAAAQAVADVPIDFQYLVHYATTTELRNDFVRNGTAAPYTTLFSVSTSEGGNGLPYATSVDWRSDTAKANILQPSPNPGFRVRAAFKYAAAGNTPIILASGVEARLIEAESDLDADGTQWLTILNMLRATCTPGSSAIPRASCSPVLINFPAPPAALPQILDPGTTAARIDTLFKERAAWLYLTGHRLGDLRRLVRQYRRSQGTVFPSGPYVGGTGSYGENFDRYGSQVTLPVPTDERARNPKYTGCINREA